MMTLVPTNNRYNRIRREFSKIAYDDESTGAISLEKRMKIKKLVLNFEVKFNQNYQGSFS